MSKNKSLENEEIKQTINSISNEPKKEKIVINNLTIVTIVFIVLFGFYIHLNGDKSIGGGFQSGVIMAISLILYNFTSGKFVLLPENSRKIGSIGLFLYFSVTLASIFFGYEMLDFGAFCYKEENRSCYSAGLFLIELSIGIGVFGAIFYIYQSFMNFVDKDFKAFEYKNKN